MGSSEMPSCVFSRAQTFSPRRTRPEKPPSPAERLTKPPPLSRTSAPPPEVRRYI